MSSPQRSFYGFIVIKNKYGADFKRFPLVKKNYRFGRHPTNDIIIKRPNVADFHCYLEIGDDSQVWLFNVANNPGDTLLNTSPVFNKIQLCHKDVFSISSRCFEYIHPNHASNATISNSPSPGVKLPTPTQQQEHQNRQQEKQPTVTSQEQNVSSSFLQTQPPANSQRVEETPPSPLLTFDSLTTTEHKKSVREDKDDKHIDKNSTDSLECPTSNNVAGTKEEEKTPSKVKPKESAPPKKKKAKHEPSFLDSPPSFSSSPSSSAPNSPSSAPSSSSDELPLAQERNGHSKKRGHEQMEVEEREGEKGKKDFPKAQFKPPEKRNKTKEAQVSNVATPSLDMSFQPSMEYGAHVNGTRDPLPSLLVTVDLEEDKMETSPSKPLDSFSPKRRKKKIPKNNLFKGYGFCFTGFDEAKTMSELRMLVKHSGGDLINSVNELYNYSKQAYLLCPKVSRTVKYMFALVHAIPCVNYTWLTDCLEERKILKVKKYQFPAGHSLIDKETKYQSEKPLQIFDGMRIEMLSPRQRSTSPAKSQLDIEGWRLVLKAMGAITVERLFQEDSTIDLVINMEPSQPDHTILKIIKKRKIPLVSLEWVIHCILHRKKLQTSDLTDPQLIIPPENHVTKPPVPKSSQFFPFQQLSTALQCHILTFLSLQDLAAFQQVSKSACSLVAALWDEVYEKNYPRARQTPTSIEKKITSFRQYLSLVRSNSACEAFHDLFKSMVGEEFSEKIPARCFPLLPQHPDVFASKKMAKLLDLAKPLYLQQSVMKGASGSLMVGFDEGTFIFADTRTKNVSLWMCLPLERCKRAIPSVLQEYRIFVDKHVIEDGDVVEMKSVDIVTPETKLTKYKIVMSNGNHVVTTTSVASNLEGNFFENLLNVDAARSYITYVKT